MALVSTAAFPDGPNSAVVEAPRSQVGTSVMDWVNYFGDNYAITGIDSVKGHGDVPILRFWITDGNTTARFGIDLSTNRHMLIEVQSVSPRFLEFVGVTDLELDSNGNAVVEQCRDAGCDKLRVNREPSGHFGAVWDYYWD